MSRVTNSNYRALAGFRYEIRKFLAFSEKAARSAGIEPQQHQMLLAIRGLPDGVRPTMGAVAERLCVQQHTAVALADKLEERGLLARERSEQDRRVVMLRLTAEGEGCCEACQPFTAISCAASAPRWSRRCGRLLKSRRGTSACDVPVGRATTRAW